MDAKCDPLVTLMMGGEFRLLRTAKRAMRAEMTIVIVIAIMTTWCVYALYKMVTTGDPFDPQQVFRASKINLSEQDRQMVPSLRVAQLASQDHIYSQLDNYHHTKPNPTVINNVSLDYHSSYDYDTSNKPVISTNKQTDIHSTSYHGSRPIANVYGDDLPSTLLQDKIKGMVGSKREPSPSISVVKFAEANMANSHHSGNSSNNGNSSEIGVAKIDSKDNEHIVKKIDSKLNIIPVASFVTKDEPEEVDYRINIDDLTYDDVNGADERNLIPGIDVTNSTGSEPEETNEEGDNEDSDSFGDGTTGDDNNNEEDTNSEVDPNGGQNSDTSPEDSSGDTTKQPEADEKTDREAQATNTAKTDNSSMSTMDDEHSPNGSNDTALGNGRVTFDEPPEGITENPEEDNEVEPERKLGNETSGNYTNKLSGQSSRDQSQIFDDLPMDENNSKVGTTTVLPPRLANTSHVVGNSLLKARLDQPNKKIRVGSAYDGGGSKKYRHSDRGGTTGNSDEVSEQAELATIMPNIPNYRFRRDTGRMSSSPVANRLVAPYDFANPHVKLRKRSFELGENIGTESSDTHLSQQHPSSSRVVANKKSAGFTNNNDTLEAQAIGNEKVERSDSSPQESKDVEALAGITHLPLQSDNSLPSRIVPLTTIPAKPSHTDNDPMINELIDEVIQNEVGPIGVNLSSAVDHEAAADLHRENQLLDNLYNVDHGLLLYPSDMDEEKEKKKSHYKKKHSKYKKEHKHKMSKGYKKGGEKKKKHKKEEKKFLKEKGFKGAKKGKKVVKGKGGQGGKKGMKHYKDKGYKKKGFKNVYHKEEFGDSKKYFDEFRDKDFKKKWKKFDDKYDYKQMKKWQGKDVKKAKKYKDHGENYKKTGKSKWKKKLSKSSKKGEKHNSHGEKKKKKTYGF